MKHSFPVTIIILIAFLLAQFVGIAILYSYIDPVKTAETGQIEFKDLPIGERPQMEEQTAFIPVMGAVIIGTILLLILIKFNLRWLWKIWFLIAVSLSLVIAFGAFLPLLPALVLGLALAIWKIFKPNFWIQNMSELFVYGGLAAIFVPVFNLFSISILLLLISVYDAYAVWKSKHMITLAKSQADAKVFAGLLIPYSLKASPKPMTARQKAGKKVAVPASRTAILGGGDIGFPLLFAGVLLKEMGLWQALLIPFFTGAALFLLLWFSQEKKFYPAMPFLSAGCFIGWGVVMLVSWW